MHFKTIESLYSIRTLIFLLTAWAASLADTSTGADRLFENNFETLIGKSVGLVTNSAATNLHDSSLVSALAQHPAIHLKALFTPEHGFYVNAAAGVAVENQLIYENQVKVFSLYGRIKKPTPEMLRDLDVLLFDIQEVGARFYTYISTMALTMEAAAESGLPYIVLDRPNPVSLFGVNGPVLDDELLSFVGIAPIPLLHGMTIGELAKMIVGEGWINGAEKLELTVIPLSGWDHSTPFDSTGLPWIAPSPNIPDLETACLYPGIGLFEATNLSEGRGTMEPFKTFGAPWIEKEFLDQMACCPGLECQVTQFVPRHIESMAIHPKYEGNPCNGLRLSISELSQFDPINCGLSLLVQIRDSYSDKLEIDDERMAKMLGSREMVELLRSGASVEELGACYQEKLSAFKQVRQKYLLYD